MTRKKVLHYRRHLARHPPLIALAAGPESGPTGRWVAHELHLAVREVRATLPPRRRRIFVAVHVDGQPAGQAARAVGLSGARVRAIASEVKRHLREYLGERTNERTNERVARPEAPKVLKA